MLVLGIMVVLLIIFNKERFKKIIFWKYLFISYCILLGGWFFTVLEGFFLENLVNVLEHISYLGSAVMLLVWCWKASAKILEEAMK